MASHGHKHAHDHHEGQGPSGIWKPHKDWRAWAALLLMLAAIAAYVLTLDDSLLPR